MKKITTLFLLIFYQISFAQENNTITIDWIDGEYNVNETTKVNLPHFNSDSFIYDDIKKTIFYSKKIEVGYFIDEKSIIITNVVFETISDDKLSNLDKQNIPSDVNATAQNANARDTNFALIAFSPIIKEGNVFKKDRKSVV